MSLRDLHIEFPSASPNLSHSFTSVHFLYIGGLSSSLLIFIVVFTRNRLGEWHFVSERIDVVCSGLSNNVIICHNTFSFFSSSLESERFDSHCENNFKALLISSLCDPLSTQV